MEPQPRAKSLNLAVSNFGPIIEADIDLRPLTVFAGPSNTGKSYMAILIYALHRFFSGAYGAGPIRLTGGIKPLGLPDDLDILDDVWPDVVAWLERSETSPEPESESSLAPIPKSVERLLLRSMDISEYHGEVFIDETMRCFGKDSPERLIRYGSQTEAKVAIKNSVADTSLEYEIEMAQNDMSSFRSSIPKAIPPEIASRLERAYARNPRLRLRFPHRTPPGQLGSYSAARALEALSDAYSEEYITPLSSAVHYLPADRTGIMHAHQVVVASLISRASRAGLRRDAPLPVLSGVLADFLENLITLSERPRRPRPDSDYQRAAKRIEDRMLGGAVQVSKSPASYPEFHYRPKGWKETLPLMSAASMVSELAPVILYLRHVVAPGDTLIIEEPESHLHPAMQVEFIRQLAAVTRAGVRVILTTHSEWVLDELGNLARLSLLSESDRKGIPGADYALNPEDVGVWLFRPKTRPKGSVVEEIPLGEEYGGYSESFSDVAFATYNSHAEISNRIEEARNR